MNCLREILITGHPRSGTGYCAKLLQHNGLDVKHEEMGGLGTSSWLFAVPGKNLPFTFDNTDPTQFVFKHRLQVIRDPLKCVSSVYYTEDGSLEYRSKFMLLNGNGIQKAVQSVIYWNNIIKQSANLVFKLEDPSKMMIYLQDVGLIDKPIDFNRVVNAREHDQLTLKDIEEAVPAPLYLKFLNFIEYYNNL